MVNKKYIIFIGGKNNGSDSSVRGLTIASLYFTEINLLNLDFIDQAVKRTLTFKDKRRIYATFNPRGARDPFILKNYKCMAKGTRTISKQEDIKL